MIKKTKRYQVVLNSMQEEALKKLMIGDMQTNVSAYFGLLITEVIRRRAEDKGEKRPVGRPRKEDGEDDTETMVLHPDQTMNKGRLITKGEYNILAKRQGKPEID